MKINAAISTGFFCFSMILHITGLAQETKTEPKPLTLKQCVTNYADACNQYDKKYERIKLFEQKINEYNVQAQKLADKMPAMIMEFLSTQLSSRQDSVSSLCNSTKINSIVKQINSNLASINAYNDSLGQRSQLDSLSKIKDRWGKELQNRLVDTTGYVSVNIRGVEYTFFVTDTTKHRIDLHFYSHKDSANFKTLRKLHSHLDTLYPKKVLMLTNAGMFTPSKTPEGLYISGTRDTTFELDLGPENDLNFYLKPNGVFYCDRNGLPHVVKTEKWVEMRKDTSTVSCATQSGPILLDNGSPHPKFRYTSSNKLIRSGVGIVGGKPSKAVFAITSNDSNFMDFAEVLKYFFGCENALFLDGTISKMYLKGSKEIDNSSFGPMISVIEK